MAGRRAVAVAGTHGKTTTTSMLTVALQHCGADPSFAIGGDLNESGANAHHGTGDVFVAEADESDGSFLAATPRTSPSSPTSSPTTSTTTAPPRRSRTRSSTSRDGIRPGGFLVACADDAGARAPGRAARAARRRRRTYGESAGADVRSTTCGCAGPRSAFERRCRAGGGSARSTCGSRGATTRSTPRRAGRRPRARAAPSRGCARGSAASPGPRRRFELKGTAGGVRVYRRLRPPPDRARRRR